MDGWILGGTLLAGALAACQQGSEHLASDPDVYASERRRMVEEQLAGRDIADPQVLRVMGLLPRDRFVPEALRAHAYEDRPLPIGEGQTISQPYIVAYMTQALRLRPTDRVLEIGTGSGYQAAVLAHIVAQVYSIEIVPELASSARLRLQEMGYRNLEVRTGDGYLGWPEQAPFDVIVVTAAPNHVPPALVEQLCEGGRMVLPVGDHYQELVRLVKEGGLVQEERLLPVRFVPMTGRAQE
jgi:protein-L-isoaspartate(D-aspartate) O-methyltransferase